MEKEKRCRREQREGERERGADAEGRYHEASLIRLREEEFLNLAVVPVLSGA